MKFKKANIVIIVCIYINCLKICDVNTMLKSLIFFQPLLSPHHPLKSPFINSSSEGELSDEYVVVGNQAKASAQHSVTNIPPTVTSASGNADQHDGDTTVATADAQSPILTSTQLEQVQRDLQSILQRLNSLETLLKRRRVRKCNL